MPSTVHGFIAARPAAEPLATCPSRRGPGALEAVERFGERPRKPVDVAQLLIGQRRLEIAEQAA